MTLDSRVFRHALGRYATGVTIVTTRSETSSPIGFTANSFSSVSLDPPLVLFCLDRSAGCYPVFAASTHFAVNILTASQRTLSMRFAGSAPLQWNGVDHHSGPHGSPMIAGALARLECARHALHDGGDHGIFVGRVLAVETDGSDDDPLVYYASSYRRLSS